MKFPFFLLLLLHVYINKHVLLMLILLIYSCASIWCSVSVSLHLGLKFWLLGRVGLLANGGIALRSDL